MTDEEIEKEAKKYSQGKAPMVIYAIRDILKMKYIIIDKEVWSLQPIFLCKDKCFAPIDVDEVYKNKAIKFFIFKYNAIKIAKKYETCDVFSVRYDNTEKHRASFRRVYKSKYSIENDK